MALTTTAPSGLVTGANVAADESGDGRNFTTKLDLNEFTVSIAGAAAEGVGYLIGTFPAGVQHVEVSYLNVSLQGAGVVDADTPDVGVGTVVATGAVAVLGGTPAFEDIIDGQTAADCSGTATVALLKPDDELSVVGDVKSIYLNIADTWAGADTITVSGSVTLKWVNLG